MLVSIKKLKQTNWIDEEPSAEEQAPIALDFAGSSFESSGLAFPSATATTPPEQVPNAQAPSSALHDDNTHRAGAFDERSGSGERKGIGVTGDIGQSSGIGENSDSGECGERSERSECSENCEAQGTDNAGVTITPSPPHDTPLSLPKIRTVHARRWGWLGLSLSGHLAIIVLGYFAITILFHSPFLKTLRPQKVLSPSSQPAVPASTSPASSALPSATPKKPSPADSTSPSSPAPHSVLAPIPRPEPHRAPHQAPRSVPHPEAHQAPRPVTDPAPHQAFPQAPASSAHTSPESFPKQQVQTRADAHPENLPPQQPNQPREHQTGQQDASPLPKETEQKTFLLPSGQVVHMMDLSDIPENLFQDTPRPNPPVNPQQ